MAKKKKAPVRASGGARMSATLKAEFKETARARDVKLQVALEIAVRAWIDKKEHPRVTRLRVLIDGLDFDRMPDHVYESIAGLLDTNAYPKPSPETQAETA